jgi:hypothetical protein
VSVWVLTVSLVCAVGGKLRPPLSRFRQLWWRSDETLSCQNHKRQHETQSCLARRVVGLGRSLGLDRESISKNPTIYLYSGDRTSQCEYILHDSSRSTRCRPPMARPSDRAATIIVASRTMLRHTTEHIGSLERKKRLGKRIVLVV